MIPILFNENEKNFTSQGLGALKDVISCTVDEERNGIYELEMEYPITGIHYEDIAKRKIIYAIPSPYRAPQPFRIYEISRPMSGVTTVYAAHLSYDLNGIPVSPFSATGIGPALDGLKSHMEIANDFNFATDITSDAAFSVDIPAACRNCLGGVEGSILDTYGGEYLWDKFTVNLKANRGVNSGVSIRYRKNLTDLKHNENVENTVTGIYPYWNDSNGNLVMCDPPIIWAEGNFGYQKAVPVSFTEEFETQPTTEQLQQAAESYIKRNDIGVPTVSMTVGFIQLEQMTGYEDITLLEKCDLCDTVTVQYEQLGVNATAKIVKISTNVLTERYNNMEIGSVRANIAQTIADQQKEIEKKPPMSMIEGAISGATETITGNQGGNVILRLNEAGKPYELLIMDTDDIKTAQNVWRFNQSGWGLSKNGYNGPYEIAATINDGFVADFITAGTMLADRIRGGTLEVGGSGLGKDGEIIIKDANDNILCILNDIGVDVRKGSIIGTVITLGGQNNQQGEMTVNNASGSAAVKLDGTGLWAILGTIGGWTIASDILWSEVAMIASYEGTNHNNRATMNNASFKIWVGGTERCYLGRGGYNGRGSSDSGLFFVSGPGDGAGVEIDGSTGRVNAQGDIQAGGDMHANGNIEAQGNVTGQNIESMSNQIGSLGGDISGLDGRINSLASSISSLSSAVSSLDSRVSALEDAS